MKNLILPAIKRAEKEADAEIARRFFEQSRTDYQERAIRAASAYHSGLGLYAFDRIATN